MFQESDWFMLKVIIYLGLASIFVIPALLVVLVLVWLL